MEINVVTLHEVVEAKGGPKKYELKKAEKTYI